MPSSSHGGPTPAQSGPKGGSMGRGPVHGAGRQPPTRESMMFDLKRRSTRPDVDADRLKAQAAEVGAVLADASAHAGKTATQLADQAKVAAGQAKVWATPRVEHAVEWA